MPSRLLTALASVAGLVGAVPAVASRPSPAPAILAAAPGLMLAQALRQAFALSPPTSGPAMIFATWSGSLPILQQRVASATAEPDLLLMANADLLAACRQGLLIPLDRTVLGGRASSPGASACGIPAFYDATVLAWDETRDHTPPEWADFWDVARTPGKRGLPRRARGTLEMALMADGVAPRDVYRVLGSSQGAARAFRKLDQLRPYVVWWSDGEKADKALESGSVMMTMAPASYAAGLVGGKTLAVGQQWADGLVETLGWAVPVGAPEAHAAMQFLAAAPNPTRRMVLTGLLPVVDAGRTDDATERLKPMFRIEDMFWFDHPDLERRFTAWLAGSR